MSEKLWHVHWIEDGFIGEYETKEEAVTEATSHLDWLRSEAASDGEWPVDVGLSVFKETHRAVGKVHQEDGEEFFDYELEPTEPPPQWSLEWPTNEGWFWCYGRHTQFEYPRLFVAAAEFEESKIICVDDNGDDMDPSEWPEAAWLPAQLPDVTEALALLEGEK